MALQESWGYRYGRSEIVRRLVGNTGAITAGDMLTKDGAGDQYVMRAVAGSNTLVGVAMESCAAPTADGDLSIEVEISDDAVFEYPADAGTVSAALIQKTMDVGGRQSIDIDASADDIVEVIDVDTRRNSVLVKLYFKTGKSGVA